MHLNSILHEEILQYYFLYVPYQQCISLLYFVIAQKSFNFIDFVQKCMVI